MAQQIEIHDGLEVASYKDFIKNGPCLVKTVNGVGKAMKTEFKNGTILQMIYRKCNCPDRKFILHFSVLMEVHGKKQPYWFNEGQIMPVPKVKIP